MNRGRRSAEAATEPGTDGQPPPSRATTAQQPEFVPTPAEAVPPQTGTPGETTDQASAPDLDRTDPATAQPLTLRVLALELWHAFFRTGVTGLATQFAYSLLFATFPLLILVMSLAALVDRVFRVPVANTLRDVIDRSAPVVLQPLLRDLVERAIARADTGVASVSAVVATVLAIWGASGAVGALVGACARAYGVRTKRSFPIRRLINVLLAVVIIVLIVVAAVLFVFGEAIGRGLAAWFGGGGEIDALVVALRWGLVIVCTAAALVTLYRIGPDLELSVVWLLPGTVVATVLWLLLLKGFSILLKVTNPGDPYGALGSLVVLLWFFYLTGVAFMLGAVVNAVVSRPYDERRRADLVRHPEKRLFCDDGREV
ncbi:MAG: rane protein [Thermomicrobiales bacterium]|nr:rane protein [Thermomicrobiales bacterium]